MTNLLKLMPHSLKMDPFVVAVTEAFELQMQQLRKEFDEVADLVNVTTSNEQLIDFLAFEKHVDFYEGLSIEEKQNVVKNALKIHAKKGTKYALLQIFELLFLKGEIEEWFEYEGDAFYFKASIDVSKTGVDDATVELLERLIMTYKNNRSWLEVLNVYLTSSKNKLVVGTLILTGEEIVVYPYMTKNLVTRGTIKALAAHNNDTEKLTIYPEGGAQRE